MKITKRGIWFDYRPLSIYADTILYKWPWVKGKRWVSMLSESEFSTLKELRRFWKEYDKEIDKSIKQRLRR